MTPSQTAIAKLQQLPESLLNEVNQFIDQLLQQYSHNDNQEQDISLTKSMSQMAEKSFAKIWDNADDYDNL